MSNFATLPDPCLFAIFAPLRVRDQLRLGQVCARLRLLCVSVCKQRRKLKLKIISRYLYHLHLHNKLYMRHKMYDTVVDYFPNISSLELVDCKSGIEQFSVPKLLNKLSSKLVYLKLRVRITSDTASRALIGAINSLSSLKHLNLTPFRVPNQLKHLSIITKLDTFEYEVCQEGRWSEIVDLLLKYDATALSQLKIIKFSDYSDCLKQNQLETFMQLKPEIASKFTEFSNGNNNWLVETGFLRRFCSNFRFLKHIRLDMNNISPVKHLNCLAQMVQLDSLVLSYYGTNSIESNEQIIPVFSVKRLTLEYDFDLSYIVVIPREKGFPETLKVDQHFPSVEQIQIELPFPVGLSFVGDNVTKEQSEQRLKRLIEPLKACGQPKKIWVRETFESEIEWTVTLVKPFEVVVFEKPIYMFGFL